MAVEGVLAEDLKIQKNTRTNYTLNVEMSCEACVRAVTRILEKLPHVQNVECSLEGQRVVVTMCTVGSPASGTDLLDALKPWSEAAGKKISLEKEASFSYFTAA